MVTIPAVWLLLALAATAVSLVLAHRVGAASARTRVAELEGERSALSQQLESRATLDATLAPLQQAMATLSQQVDTAERAREAALTGLSEKVMTVGQQVGDATKDVQQQAQRITQALSRTQMQGTWGEMALRRLVESAGMLDHVHFVEQSTVSSDEAALRPDMIINLSEGRQVVVDAKVSLDAFLDPAADDDAQARLHASAVADHVTRLSAKRYWKAVGTPEFVIMFLPSESMLGIALRARPDLLQLAFERKIVLATPTTLMATLRSVSWAWQQAAMADQARDVLLAGREVHDRLTTMGGHIARLGKSLGDAVGTYNQFVGSLDSRVMPAARRLAGLAAPDAAVLELAEIDVRPRAALVIDDVPTLPDPVQDTG